MYIPWGKEPSKSYHLDSIRRGELHLHSADIPALIFTQVYVDYILPININMWIWRIQFKASRASCLNVCCTVLKDRLPELLSWFSFTSVSEKARRLPPEDKGAGSEKSAPSEMVIVPKHGVASFPSHFGS